jgi:hypothetical protein
MSDLEETVLDAAAREGEALTTETFVELAERAHADEQGVDRTRLRTYANRAGERRDVRFDREAFRAELDERVTDEEIWVGREAIYDVGEGRLSRYPAEWHAELGGTSDVAAYLEYLTGTEADFVSDPSGVDAGPRIPQSELLDVIALVGRTSREAARSAVAEARNAGDVVQDADQHPNAGVYLPEDAGDVDGGPANPR